jgi:centractin
MLFFHLIITLTFAGMCCSHIFHTSSELETVRDIKEKRCYVAFNIDKLEKDDIDTNEPTVPYKLPDGNSISIGAEQFRAPEILFNPSIIGLEYSGIHQCLLDSISRFVIIIAHLSSLVHHFLPSL